MIALALCCCLMLGLGCADPRSEAAPATVDLALELPRATTEGLELDIGGPDSRALLRRGWEEQAERSFDRSWIWVVADAATIAVEVPQAGSAELALRMWAPEEGGKSVQVVIDAGDTRGVSVEVAAAPAVYTYRLPVELRPGSNLVTLHTAAGGSDRRVALERLRITPTGAAGPHADEEQDGLQSLVLPAGQGVSYYLFLGREAALSWRSGAGGPLQVDVRAVGALQPAADLKVPDLHGAGFLPLPEVIGLATVTLRASTAVVLTGGVIRHARTGRPNILFYLIDTLRADHLGCYGYDRETSPRIDRLAAEGLLFEHVQAQSSWTRSSVASMLTGLHPLVHGANLQEEALASEVLLMPEALAAAGYLTAGFTTNGNVGPGVNFDQGYDDFVFFRERPQTREVHIRADRVTEVVTSWLDRRLSDQPFFLYLHTTDPHDPYTPPPRFRDLLAPGIPPQVGTMDWLRKTRKSPPAERAAGVAAMKALYDAEIRFNDEQVGVLLDGLAQRGLYDDTLIIVTSDHGEALFEHGWQGHGLSLLQTETRIPLVIKLPRGAEKDLQIQARRIGSLVQHLDLLPTVLGMVGLGHQSLVGHDLLRAAGHEHVLSYLHRGVFHSDAVHTPRWSLLRDLRERGRGTRLYDLSGDPEEHTNLADKHPELVERFSRLLDAHRQQIGAGHEGSAPQLDEQTEDALRELGYIE